ncbi:hypothetical protein EDD21DRAFT_83645 [Dissophora ornata]|nr:hypothetical protein EDD21DRAFT_83645 [Dissophora ornata]
MGGLSFPSLLLIPNTSITTHQAQRVNTYTFQSSCFRHSFVVSRHIIHPLTHHVSISEILRSGLFFTHVDEGEGWPSSPLILCMDDWHPNYILLRFPAVDPRSVVLVFTMEGSEWFSPTRVSQPSVAIHKACGDVDLTKLRSHMQRSHHHTLTSIFAPLQLYSNLRPPFSKNALPLPDNSPSSTMSNNRDDQERLMHCESGKSSS